MYRINLLLSNAGDFTAGIFRILESSIKVSMLEFMSKLQSLNPELCWQTSADGIVNMCKLF